MCSFINRKTLKAGLDYVNNALNTFGFPSPLTLVHGSSQDAEKSVNCIMALLLERQKDLEYKAEAEERYRKLQIEADAHQQQIHRMQQRLEVERREKDAAALKLGYVGFRKACLKRRCNADNHDLCCGAFPGRP